MNITSRILTGLTGADSIESIAVRCCLCSFILLIGIWLAVCCQHRSSAALRHRILLLGLAGVLFLPVVIPLTQGWNPTIRLLSESEKELIPPAPVESFVEHEISPFIDRRSQNGLLPSDYLVPQAEIFEETSVSLDSREPSQTIGSNESATDPTTGFRKTASPGSTNISIEILLFTVWGIVAFLLVFRLVTQQLLIGKIVRTAIPVKDVKTLAILDSVNRSNRFVTLLCSDSTPVPVAVGILRPAIVLPTGYGKWSEDRLRIVLLHEQAHIERCDVFAQSIAQFACIFYWFNPLIWLAARRMRLERELACDDAVLCSGENASNYADHLVEIAAAIMDRWQVPHTASAMATRTNLQTRVRHLFQHNLDRRSVSKRTSSSLIALASVFLVLLAIGAPSIATTLGNTSPESKSDISAIELTLTGDAAADWSDRLKSMPNVQKLTIRQPTRENLQSIQFSELKQLTSFRAEDFSLESKLADMAAAQLTKLPKIKSVTFQHTGLTSSGLQSLRSSSLTDLELVEEELITDDGFADIEKIPSLSKLVLDATPIEVAGLKHLQACSQLKSLVLRRHPAGSSRDGADQRMAAIGKLSSLEELEIDSTAYTRLIALKEIKSLKQLTLRRCGGVEASRSFKQLTQLNRLILDNCDFRDETQGDVQAALAEAGIEVVDQTRQAGTDLLTRTSSPVNEATRLARQVHDDLNVAKHYPAFWVRRLTYSSEVPSMKAEPIRTVHRLKKTLTENHVRRPYSQDTIMAWSPHQFYTVNQTSENGKLIWEQIKYGDAKVAWSREGSPEELPRHVIRNGIAEFADSLFYIPAQLQVSQQTYWWGVGTHHNIATSSVPPQQATYNELPSVEFAGETCRVLESAGRSERLWISKKTGRLRGSLSYIHQGYFIPFYQQDIVTKIAGRTITSLDEYRTLVGDGEEALPTEKQHQLSIAWAEYHFHHAIPGRLHVFSDYREITPGRWFSFRVQNAGWHHNKQNQGHYDFYSSESVVTEIAVDRDDLKKYWAAVLPNKGENVQDQRYGVPVDYEYQADRTADELQRLVNEQLFKYARSAMLITERTGPISKMIGKPAPALSADRWIGTQPDLKGKRYLIHFWAAWCAPCKNDVPLLNSLTKNRTVIGLHPSGTEMEQIRKTIKDTKMSYSTVVAPPGSKDIFGYPVKLFPYCVEVDEEGNVARHGTLHEIFGADTEVVSKVQLPTNTRGVVLGTQSKQGLVAVSLGEADGVQKGQLFNAIRDERRVQFRIVFVQKNHSVGQIMDENDKAKIKQGDEVLPSLE
ncbi:M56 family metallopeptidase [Gimesia algae]|uniref:Regulatory protein BlaR1 n=1 Tax=Gimesia algae TaxID=2527971 RepID=A0A517VGP8_9PLAN|nr:M56 family metallopeptidase [Gimesia algae]QDT92191.1 Regulatory protein BlaR1 [Gimesia algae]